MKRSESILTTPEPALGPKLVGEAVLLPMLCYCWLDDRKCIQLVKPRTSMVQQPPKTCLWNSCGHSA